jgi:hypothetical protein
VGSFKRIRDTAIVVLLLSVSFFFLRASIRNPQDMNPVVSALSRVGAPLEYMASAVARFVSSAVSQYVYLVDVKQDNNRLAYENARLSSRVRELEQAQADNRRLRRLLGLRDTIPHEMVSAVVVGKDTTEFFRVAHVTLDSPHASIRPDMPVISLDGAVGTVQRVAGEKIALPDSLAHRIALFRGRGRLLPHAGSWGPSDWLAVMLGRSIIPASWDPLADDIEPQRAQQNFVRLAGLFRQSAETMPRHVDYIAHHCPAKS